MIWFRGPRNTGNKTKQEKKRQEVQLLQSKRKISCFGVLGRIFLAVAAAERGRGRKREGEGEVSALLLSILLFKPEPLGFWSSSCPF